MQITVTHDDGSTADITSDVLRIWDVVSTDIRAFRYECSLEDEDIEAALRVAEVCQISDGPALVSAVEWMRKREAEEQRRRDERVRAEMERRADVARAAAHLAAEMREREPALVRAGWTDDQLVELHAMRNAGTA